MVSQLNQLEVSYATWKQLATANLCCVTYHFNGGNNRVTAYSGSRLMIYITEVHPADYGDWSTTFSATSTEVATHVDGLARVFGLNVKPEPVTRDGRRIIAPSTIGDAQEVQFTGSGDDIASGQRLMGADFRKLFTNVELSYAEWQYMEWVEIGGGRVDYYNAVDRDFYHYDIYAPATVGTPNAGQGAFLKYNLGGPCNIYVPHPTGNGDWDIDLDETLNPYVNFSKGVPVPAIGNDGYFDWCPENYCLCVNAEGAGAYNLFDFEIALTRIVNKHWMYGSDKDDFVVPASYAAKRLLPHYIHRITVNRTTDAATMYIYWEILLGRATTTP